LELIVQIAHQQIGALIRGIFRVQPNRLLPLDEGKMAIVAVQFRKRKPGLDITPPRKERQIDLLLGLQIIKRQLLEVGNVIVYRPGRAFSDNRC
jgi:hypothetical protein